MRLPWQKAFFCFAVSDFIANFAIHRLSIFLHYKDTKNLWNNQGLSAFFRQKDSFFCACFYIHFSAYQPAIFAYHFCTAMLNTT